MQFWVHGVFLAYCVLIVSIVGLFGNDDIIVTIHSTLLISSPPVESSAVSPSPSPSPSVTHTDTSTSSSSTQTTACPSPNPVTGKCSCCCTPWLYTLVLDITWPPWNLVCLWSLHPPTLWWLLCLPWQLTYSFRYAALSGGFQPLWSGLIKRHVRLAYE